MSSFDEITGRKRHARNIYKSLLESPALSRLPADYIGPAGLTRRDIIEKIERLGSCCSNIYVAELQSGKYKIHKGDFCKNHIVCGTCANRIQNLRRKRFTPAIADCARRSDPDYNGTDRLFAYLVTFTVKDGTSVLETHRRLKAAMLKFRKMGQERPIYRKGIKVGIKRGSGEWSRVVAAVGTHEIIRGEAGGVHSHCHILIFTESRFNYVTYDRAARKILEKKYGRGNIPAGELKRIEIDGGRSKISLEWQAAAGGDAINIDVAPMYRVPRTRPGKAGVSEKTVAICSKLNYVDSITYQAREVLKYAAKAESQDNDFTLQLIDETPRKRFFEAFGLFRGLSNDDNFNETETTAADQVMGIYKISWDDRAGEYSEKKQSDDPGIDDQFIGIYGLYRYKQNQIVGKYRTNRSAMLRAGGVTAAALNARRDKCREELKNLWAGYKVDKNDGAYIKALGMEYKKPEMRFSYSNFIFLNFRDPVRLEMLKDVYRNYLNKKLYAETKTENQKEIERSENDW